MQMMPDRTPKDRRRLIAFGLMAIAALFNAGDAVLVRMLTETIHPFVIAFFRSFFGLLFIAPWIMSKRSLLASNYSLLHLVRAGLKLLTLVAFFFAISRAELVNVTTISFAAPIFVTIGAWAFLGEHLTRRHMAAVICGFAGVLVILRPGQDTVSIALLVALGGAVLAAIIQLMLKRMSARDSTETLVAWNLILTVPLAAVPLYWFWTEPSLPQFGLLALQGVLGALNMAIVTRAISLADASYVAPLDFLRLPMISLMAFAFFGEILSLATLIGAAIIFVSSIVLTSQKRA